MGYGILRAFLPKHFYFSPLFLPPTGKEKPEQDIEREQQKNHSIYIREPTPPLEEPRTKEAGGYINVRFVDLNDRGSSRSLNIPTVLNETGIARQRSVP